MPARLLLSLAIGGFFLGLSPVRAADAAKATAPALVIRVKSIQGLVGDVKYLSSLAGREEEGKQLEGLYQSQVTNNSLHGLDPKRPLGVYAIVTPNANESYAAILVPVAD